MARLYAVLKGEAHDVVDTSLATSRDASFVMSTLELRYGN
jgi:hypothetical protein